MYEMGCDLGERATYLDGKIFQRCSLNGVDGELVVRVDSGESAGD